MSTLLRIVVGIALSLLFCAHTYAGGWSACVDDPTDDPEHCSYNEGILLETQAEARKYVRDHTTRPEKLTVEKLTTTSNGAGVRLTLTGHNIAPVSEPTRYRADNVDPSGSPYDTYPTYWPHTDLGQLVTTAVAQYAATRAPCPAGLISVGEFQMYQPGVEWGTVPDDGYFDPPVSYSIPREFAPIYVYFYVQDANYDCTIRVEDTISVERAQAFYCTELHYLINGTRDACVPKDWAQIDGPLIDCATPTCNEYAGNPINVINGEKYYQHEDGVVDGIALKRTFTSESRGLVDNFTANWTHTFSSRIFLSGTTIYAYLDSNGKWCKPYNDGTNYRCLRSEQIAFKRLPDLTWQVDSANGTREVFDQFGALLRREYPSGSSITVERNSGGQILALVSSTGRKITFAYADRRISSINFAGSLVTYSYDTGGRLSDVAYPDGTHRLYHYQDTNYPDLLTSVVGESSNVEAQYAFDSKGRTISSFHGAAGVNVAYSDLAGANKLTVENEAGLKYTFTTQGVDANKKILSRASNAPGSVTQSWVPFGGTIGSVTVPGLVITYNRLAPEYYASSVTTKINNILYKTLETGWHSTLPRPISTSTKDASNQVIGGSATTYNNRGQILSQTSTAPGFSSRTISYTYCEQAELASGLCPALGLLTSVDGARTDVTDVTLYTYFQSDDPGCATPPSSCSHRKGDLWKVTNAVGQITEYLEYDAAGHALSLKDSNGVVLDVEYDLAGRVVARKMRGLTNGSEADDAIVRFEYWPGGMIKKVTQSDGSFTSYVYNSAKHLTDIEDNSGSTIHYTLNSSGLPIQETVKDPAGTLKKSLSRVYNLLGQLQTRGDADGNPTDFTYDANGYANTTTDAIGKVRDDDYDALGRLTRSLQNAGGINAQVQFTYDVNDNVTQVNDPKGLNTNYSYNGMGDLTQVTSPDTGVTNLTYDGAGNRKTETDARNKTSTYSYDALNRITGIAYADTSLNVSYVYDTTQAPCSTGETFSVGRLTQLTDASGSTQYCFDRFGNLVRKVQTTNGIALTVRYAYTFAGQLSSVTYPDGAVATYTRDAQGRTTQVNVQRAGAVSEVLLNQANYYPFGPVAGWTYGNGRQLLRPHNLNYQPTAVHDAAAGGLSVGFAYDAVGNLTQLTPVGSTTPLVKFDYDALRRLTKFKDGLTDVAIESYSYDATGNRQSFMNSSGTQAYTYMSNSHRLSQVGGITRSYDSAGNTIAVGGIAKEFSYNDAGRMSQTKQNAIVQINYAYNGKGERVRAYTGTTNTYTLYDESGHWLGDYDSSGAALQQTIWLNDLPVGLIANSNQLHYIEPDHLGTPRVVIEVARNVPVWTWDMKSEAFGNSSPNQDPDLNSVPLRLDMRYAGQLYDSVSGLHYNYFRDFEPATGRYVESDPIGLNGGLSTYSYVGGSPLDSIDPTGLVRWTGEVIAASASGPFGITLGLFAFELTSQCVKGRKASVRILATAGGAGVGFKGLPGVGGTKSSILMEDYLPDIFVNNFNGLFVTYGAGITVGPWSAGCTAYQLGSLWSPAVTRWGDSCSLNGSKGFEVGANILFGKSERVGRVKWKQCLECEFVDTPLTW